MTEWMDSSAAALTAALSNPSHASANVPQFKIKHADRSVRFLYPDAFVEAGDIWIAKNAQDDLQAISKPYEGGSFALGLRLGGHLEIVSKASYFVETSSTKK